MILILLKRVWITVFVGVVVVIHHDITPAYYIAIVTKITTDFN